METTNEPLRLEKWSSVQWKRVDIPASFIFNILIFWHFEYGDGFKQLRWMKNLRQSTWDNKILYADRSSKDKQLLVMSLWRKTKNASMAVGWKFKYVYYFMEGTHEQLHLDIWRFVHWKIIDIQVLLKSLFPLTDLLNMAVVRRFEVMLGQTLKYVLLC
jgi:hypothetical protein